MKTYTPNPIDTSDVTLPNDLTELTEKLSENTHDVWAQTKIKHGYSYGEQTDNDAKTHSDLLPYSQLPDHIKDYDRNTTIEVLKAIHKLGYSIVRQ